MQLRQLLISVILIPLQNLCGQDTVHYFNQRLLSTCCVPGTLLGPRDEKNE